MTWWDRVMCDYPLADPADQGREFKTSDLGGWGRGRYPSLYEMESIAWVLRTDATRRHIGFVRSRDLAPGERFLLPDDEP
ncbi:MAG TPA: hypothetical protein VGQ33_01010 [Vicinamibacteria bacterium]|nr:hypothetical protein [Vicinamibacteria bacterium]